MENTYYDYDLVGYDQAAIDYLEATLKDEGFSKIIPSGLGAGVPPQQILVWLNAHTADVAVGALGNALWSSIISVVRKLRNWYGNNRPKREHKRPAIGINIYVGNRYKKAVIIAIDEIISEEDLKQRIEDFD